MPAQGDLPDTRGAALKATEHPIHTGVAAPAGVNKNGRPAFTPAGMLVSAPG